MERDVLQQRYEAHLIIDALPEEKLSAVRGLLEVLIEPLSKALAMAPIDDEGELTPETIAAIEKGRLQLQRGEYTSHEDMLREFGG
jgi:hypothetical protein